MATKPSHHLLIALGVPHDQPPSGLPPSTRSHFMPDQGEPDQDDMNPDQDDAIASGQKGDGEPGTGYLGADGVCSNCVHMEPEGTCNEPHMMQLSKQPKGPNGNPQVDPQGHCEWIKRGQPAAGGSSQQPGTAAARPAAASAAAPAARVGALPSRG